VTELEFKLVKHLVQVSPPISSLSSIHTCSVILFVFVCTVLVLHHSYCLVMSKGKGKGTPNRPEGPERGGG
jgi:hypothetical protein